ncbi:MAG: PLP-dependent aminotransferase family protein [Ktedonobacteraceae bacterium]|nr:PLP-dependent aminotransferase family protein [Ktedonobacteraceae bacterium]
MSNQSIHTAHASFLSIMLDPTASKPLYRQLYDKLRHAILLGELAGGTRLPSTRAFARNLGISRATIMIAFEQLLYEGYIYGEVGSGTYVKHVLPDDLLQSPSIKDKKQQPAGGEVQEQRGEKGPTGELSQRGKIIAATEMAPLKYWQGTVQHQTFQPGLPALREFPFKLWGQLEARHWRHASEEMFGYSDPAGYRPLRNEIAAYVQAARSVKCDAEQVIIVAGSQQAINLATQLLIDPGDKVWVEEPCYLGARGALLSSGAKLVPVPIDEEGMQVARGIERCNQARLAYVTPSHQFPLGKTMSLARRLALLQWARHTGSWILEDDYDGEYRYAGKPLASLHGLDTTERVIYIGTFSKVMFPALRLGYLVVPPQLVDPFRAARAAADRQSNIIDQLVLTDFMLQEHFARHVRRMRALYEERQQLLVEQSKRLLSGLLTINPAEAGMHLVGRLAPGIDDVHAAKKIATRRVVTNPISKYYLEHPDLSALVLGYAAFNEQEIQQGVEQVAIVLEQMAISTKRRSTQI